MHFKHRGLTARLIIAFSAAGVGALALLAFVLYQIAADGIDKLA